MSHRAAWSKSAYGDERSIPYVVAARLNFFTHTWNSKKYNFLVSKFLAGIVLLWYATRGDFLLLGSIWNVA